MDIRLTPRQHRLRHAAAEVTDFVKQFEEQCDRENGLPADVLQRCYDAIREAGFAAFTMPQEWGGGGFSRIDTVIAKEQFGQLTNGLWWLMLPPANALRSCTEQQREEYLYPTIRGERFDAFAVTEPGAGSDAGAVRASAQRVDGGYVLNGEKWFVTAGDRADYLIVHARVQPGDLHTLFLVDVDTPGVKVKRTPEFMHTFVFEHPEFLFEDVFLPDEKVLGEPGQGFDLTKAWFLDARLSIGAQTLGGAERALRTATAYALERETFGTQLMQHQTIGNMVVDSSIDLAQARALLYQVAAQADAGMDRKLLHAKAGMVKVASAEASNRIVDRSLQVLGGRGYMRENPVERLYRDVRVDRIWEGSSEIQRVVMANEIAKRGLDGLIDNPGFALDPLPEQAVAAATT